MKTTRYTIHFDNIECDMVGASIEISKREFDYQLKALRAKCGNNHTDNIDFWEHPTREYDDGCVCRTEYCFAFACAVTTLTKYECREGYRFKTAAERRANK